jgi:hypothetical protein
MSTDFFNRPGGLLGFRERDVLIDWGVMLTIARVHRPAGRRIFFQSGLRFNDGDTLRNHSAVLESCEGYSGCRSATINEM